MECYLISLCFCIWYSSFRRYFFFSLDTEPLIIMFCCVTIPQFICRPRPISPPLTTCIPVGSFFPICAHLPSHHSQVTWETLPIPSDQGRYIIAVFLFQTSRRRTTLTGSLCRLLAPSPRDIGYPSCDDVFGNSDGQASYLKV